MANLYQRLASSDCRSLWGKILPDITVVDGLLMDVRRVDEFCLLVSPVRLAM